MSSRKAYGEETRDVNSAMFLATAYDRASEVWTRSSPSSSVSILLKWISLRNVLLSFLLCSLISETNFIFFAIQ